MYIELTSVCYDVPSTFLPPRKIITSISSNRVTMSMQHNYVGLIYFFETQIFELVKIRQKLNKRIAKIKRVKFESASLTSRFLCFYIFSWAMSMLANKKYLEIDSSALVFLVSLELKFSWNQYDQLSSLKGQVTKTSSLRHEFDAFYFLLTGIDFFPLMTTERLM